MLTSKTKVSNLDAVDVKNKEPNYEQALAELEKLIQDMESGKMPLEENLAAYKRGVELIKRCQGMLDQVEQQVKIFEAE